MPAPVPLSHGALVKLQSLVAPIAASLLLALLIAVHALA
jgi:hypothetical protein